MALKQRLLLALEPGTVYPVTLKSVNPLSFSNQKSKIGFLKTATTCKLRTECLIFYYDLSLLDLGVDLRPMLIPGM